ncbi:MAG: hypothetical protein WAS21_01065 [Geminicoccaceae bacterium]
MSGSIPSRNKGDDGSKRLPTSISWDQFISLIARVNNIETAEANTRVIVTFSSFEHLCMATSADAETVLKVGGSLDVSPGEQRPSDGDLQAAQGRIRWWSAKILANVDVAKRKEVESLLLDVVEATPISAEQAQRRGGGRKVSDDWLVAMVEAGAWLEIQGQPVVLAKLEEFLAARLVARGQNPPAESHCRERAKLALGAWRNWRAEAGN